MRFVKIQRVGQSARILPIHVKGDKRGKSTGFYILVSAWQAKVTRIIKSWFLFSMIKRGPGLGQGRVLLSFSLINSSFAYDDH